MEKNSLLTALNGAGKNPVSIQFSDGTGLMILAHGARALGLFPSNSDRNFFWTNPRLVEAKSARAFFQSKQWHNSGGDRTWIAPEVDVFMPQFPARNPYRQPRQLDPGKYEVLSARGRCRLRGRFALEFSRSRSTISFELAKEFAPALNPLRYDRGLSQELAYAGYTQQVRLSITSADPSQSGPAGIWNLLQLPHGGELLVPTFGRAEPKIIFGEISPGRLRAQPQCCRFLMNGPGDSKISLRAPQCTGRAGYVFGRSSEEWDLVVRNFCVNPSAEYIDVPWDDPGALGYSVQACSANGAFGAFSELEYHAPAIGKGTGRSSALDSSQVWAFRGAPATIRAAVEQLLLSK